MSAAMVPESTWLQYGGTSRRPGVPGLVRTLKTSSRSPISSNARPMGVSRENIRS